MQRKFITNLAFLLFLNLLIKPFWILGIDRTVQNTVGAESYGLYAALFNFSFLFNIILDFGITNFNNRNIAQHSQLLNKHLSAIIFVRIFLSVIYFFVSMGVAYLFGYRDVKISMLAILLLNQALLSFILYLRSNIAGLQLFKTDTVISVLDRSIMIIICGFLLWGNVTSAPFKIEWFIWAQTFAYAVTMIVTFSFVALKAKFRKLSWNFHFFLVIIKQSYPYALLTLLMIFYTCFDTVLLERLLPDGAKQAGIYTQARRLLEAANMFAFLFSGLLLPMFAFMIKKKESPEKLTELSFSFIAVPGIIGIGTCLFFAQEIMGLLYHDHVSESAFLFRIIISCFLPMSSVYIFGTLLTANGNLKYLNLVALTGMVIYITLNLILIPKFQARGAAYATLITQTLTAGLQIILAHRVFNMKFKVNLALRYLIFTALSISIIGYLHQTDIHWIWSCIIGVIISVIISLSLLLIRPMELFKVVKAGGE